MQKTVSCRTCSPSKESIGITSFKYKNGIIKLLHPLSYKDCNKILQEWPKGLWHSASRVKKKRKKVNKLQSVGQRLILID